MSPACLPAWLRALSKEASHVRNDRSPLTKLEHELAILKAKAPRDKSNWLAEITGFFKDDPDFEEIVPPRQRNAQRRGAGRGLIGNVLLGLAF